MKKIILTIAILLITSLAYSYELKIPFSCYPKDLQDDFADKGIKLDLSGNDRTPDSWGFIDNRGSNFIICTYKPLDIEELELVKKIIFGGMR
jgi:hypothetical protein